MAVLALRLLTHSASITRPVLATGLFFLENQMIRSIDIDEIADGLWR